MSWATGVARSVVHRYREAADLRWRAVPPLAVSARAGAQPTVYYLSPSPGSAAGGVRNIYRHVDCLNALGVRAAVVHPRAGTRCTWFANDTRVLGAPEVVLGPADLLVVPECFGPRLDRLPDGIRVVIFNQGAYHTFDRLPYESTAAGAPYAGLPGLAALLTVSQDSADLLRYVFATVPVEVARLVIDPAVFHPAALAAGAAPPPRRISYLTHRRAPEREQLRHILRARGVPPEWELTPITGRTEAETAEIMRGSAIFLSFSEREGFGLPPAEAMASGCYVVGYPGLGGRDYFDPRYCAPVPDGDLLAFARAVEEACAAYERDPRAFAGAGRAASEAILGRYSSGALRADLRAFYAALMPM